MKETAKKNVKLIGTDDEYGWAVALGNQYICHVYRHGEHAYEMRAGPGLSKSYTNLDEIVKDLGAWFGTEVSVGGL